MFSILHISDLHRSRDEPVDNDSLIAALLAVVLIGALTTLGGSLTDSFENIAGELDGAR